MRFLCGPWDDGTMPDLATQQYVVVRKPNGEIAWAGEAGRPIPDRFSGTVQCFTFVDGHRVFGPAVKLDPGVVLDPRVLPEPATGGLLAALVLLALLARRRRC